MQRRLQPWSWKPVRHITSVLDKKGKELNKTSPVQLCPSPSCPCLHSQLNAPLVLLHTASELQLWVPVAHSSISKERTRCGDFICIELAVIDCVQTFRLLSRTCSFGPILQRYLTSTRALVKSFFICLHWYTRHQYCSFLTPCSTPSSSHFDPNRYSQRANY